MHHQFSFALLASLAAASPLSLSTRSECQTGYTLCSPSGVTSSNTPEIGDSDFTHLYQDIVLSNLPTFTSRKRSSNNHNELPSTLLESRASASLCCISSLACLTMHNLNIPFCYDKFTTNYFLPDNSYGTIVGGSYTSSSGAHANLESGNFTKADGTTGNIYSADPAAAPNTATLPIPSQYTASGVGSAIPASALGGVTVTYTTTYMASTVPATTIPGTTVSGSVSTFTTEEATSSGGVTSTNTSTGTTTLPGTTSEGTTRQASTVSASVATVTTVESAGSSASASASATGKKNEAGRGRGVVGWGAVVGGLVGGIWGVL
ncbi:hypothetical protein ACMFMG_011469 [Clarireedia jacksonii]